MSSVADKSSTGDLPTGLEDAETAATACRRRHYDAQASRQALLDAGRELFDERGYEPATVREIGERAGVDAALIARYFGGKEGLYLAALQQQEGRVNLPSNPVGALEHMLRHAEDRGSGPIGLAMVSPTLTDAMRDQVREIVHRYVVEPLTAELQARAVPDAELRAELLAAIATGVSLIRGGGTLPALAQAPLEDVLAALRPLADALGGRP